MTVCKVRLCVSVLFMLLFVLVTCVTSWAASFKYPLLAQYDWARNLGFCLQLELDGPGQAPMSPQGMKLVLGMADGRIWRYVNTAPLWVYDKDYVVRVVGDGKSFSLWLDGTQVGTATCKLAPLPDTDVGRAAGTEDWAAGPVDFMVRQGSLTVRIAGGEVVRRVFGQPASGVLSFFGATQIPVAVYPLKPNTGGSLEVEASFRLLPKPDLKAFLPVVDRFGQVVKAEWGNKIKTDADLKASYTSEIAKLDKMGSLAGVDKYGGVKTLGWREKGTGFYRVVKRAGVWWLITPDGLPCFYTGVCTAPDSQGGKTPITGREALFTQLPPWGEARSAGVWGENSGVEYVSFQVWNLMRKFGTDWERKSIALTAKRLKAWGFTGLGKWAPVGGLSGVPDIAVLHRWPEPDLVRRPDFLDKSVAASLRSVLEDQMDARKKDPMLVGWSLGNEFDEIVTEDEIFRILQLEGSHASKVSLVDYAVKSVYSGSLAALAKAWKAKGDTVGELASHALKAPASDMPLLRRYYEDAYYSYLYKAIKGIDPNHMYLGSWISVGWWAEEQDWDIAAKHCDVLGYDRYSNIAIDSAMAARLTRVNKPALLGEFGFSVTYGGQRGLGQWPWAWASDDTEAGALYGRHIREAAKNPFIVGALWFQYRDEPVTGRGPGYGPNLVYGENYGFGLVDGTDQPKWQLLVPIRAANLVAASLRAAVKP